MDPITGAVVIAGLTTVGKPTAVALTSIISKIISPSAEAVGEGIAAPLHAWAKRRGELASKTLMEAAAMLHEAALEPHPVPGRLLMPILEHASLEEDPDLARKWAALLASASTKGSTILPAYVAILSSLSPIEAKVVNVLHHFKGTVPKHNVIRYGVQDHEPYELQVLLQNNYQVIMENLHRMGLLFPTFGGRNRDDNDPSVHIPIPGRYRIQLGRDLKTRKGVY